MGKKILFISTLNLSTNPRILKEIKLADSLKYRVSFLGFHLGNWSDNRDAEIRKLVSTPEYIYLDASRKPYLRWLRHSLLERFNRIIWKLDRNSLFLSATASTKRTFALLDFARKVRPGEYDLVIGHTLGAFYPASVIAGKAACPYAFDMEDYHPGEHLEGNHVDEIDRRINIMKRILPGAEYISASSAFIGQLTKQLCGLDDHKLITVLNFFYSTEFRPPVPQISRKIKLIWFSHFIGPGRGLDMMLSDWDFLKENFELTLIGIPDENYKEIFRDDIEIIQHLPQTELHALLGHYDIGLALELTSRDINKDNALSNKMLAYYQAGVFILATDTAAQKDFMEKHPDSGILFSQDDATAFSAALQYIRENINIIRSGVLKRYQDAFAHSWEKESEKLRKTWNQILQ